MYRLTDDINGTPDAAEVPVVGAALGQIHLRRTALLGNFHLQTVLLITKENAVAHVKLERREAALMQSGTSFSAVNGHTGIGENGLEGEQNLPAFPFLRQRELIFIESLLVGNALGRGLAVEAHAILVSAKTLQFPTRRHTDLCPFAAVAPVGTLEIPLHHIVTAPAAQVLAVCLRIIGHYRCGHGGQKQSAKYDSFHIVS